jgi:erythromycin esterase-like protein
VVWAADIHVSRSLVPNGALPLGSFLAAKLGRNYVSFALTAYHTEVEFGSRNCNVSPALPGSVEDRLHALGEDALLVDLARSSYLQPGVYQIGIFPFQPHRNFNGILFFETSERMQPLAWEPCRP